MTNMQPGDKVRVTFDGTVVKLHGLRVVVAGKTEGLCALPLDAEVTVIEPKVEVAKVEHPWHRDK